MRALFTEGKKPQPHRSGSMFNMARVFPIR
jgi:hypothetical protein